MNIFLTKSWPMQLKNAVKLLRHEFDGNTHQALIFWHCLTNGSFTDILANKNKKPIKDFPPATLRSIFSKDSVKQVDRIVSNLRQDGYHVLEEPLANDLCDEIINAVAKAPAYIRRSDSDMVDISAARKSGRFFEDPPKGVIYDCSFADIMHSEAMQTLVSEPLFWKVAAGYLETVPKLDPCNLWWSVPSKNKGDSLAQDYHFDMDTIRWIKVFVYLSDVGQGNGPHSFLKGSHRSGKIPFSLRKKGYSRLKDEDVFKYFSKQDEIEFTGKKGTIIFEDTKGLHKGTPVLEGSRLIMSMQFSNVLFESSKEQRMISHHQNSFWGKIKPISENFKQMLEHPANVYKKYVSK